MPRLLLILLAALLWTVGCAPQALAQQLSRFAGQSAAPAYGPPPTPVPGQSVGQPPASPSSPQAVGQPPDAPPAPPPPPVAARPTAADAPRGRYR